ncbi:hypothetical protein GGX14DRAFT_701115 [Mycena pura]|uniref:F-box domain-containing protein n=1 Tax=Mycena pura TaxID=153505 RepID=A0AAD6US30_9AGAR|nr:hypothetical protein GGX14DRAFT_701115 [Mycena pura]
MRVYLARNDIPDPDLKCEVYLQGLEPRGALGLLHALNLAAMTFFRSTDSLSLIFLNGDLSLGLRDLARATRLVERLTHLREVSLEFRSTIDICGGGIVTNKAVRMQWDARFTELWMAILRNRSVATLVIRTKWDFFQGYMLYTPARLDKRTPMAGFVKFRLKALWHRIRDAQKRLALRISVGRASHLLPPGRLSITTFHMESPLIFLPVFYYLAVLTLRRSKITSLKLNLNAKLNGALSERQWWHVFEDIVAAVPDLARLTIVNAHMMGPRSLCRFLLRLPRLAHLAIAPPTQYSHWSPPNEPEWLQDIPRFPHLTVLSVGSEYLAIFLKRPDFLSTIERLNISIPMGDLMSPSLLNDLAPIRRFPALYISVKLDRINLGGGNSDMERCIEFALGMEQKWEDVFGRVQDLALMRPGTLYDTGALHEEPLFSRWLAHFPALKRVTWDNCSSDEFPFVLVRRGIYESSERPVPEASAANSSESQSSRPGINLLDLPDELLIAIFQLLSEELFDLGLVSRRLNFLALPLFLAKRRIWNFSTRCCTIYLPSNPKARDPIAALTVALSLPHVKELRINVFRLTYIYPSLNHLRRLVSVIRRMTVFESVSLYFAISKNRQPGEHHAFLQYRWCSLFEELLNVIVSKPCTRLSVRGSPYLFPEATRWNHRLLSEHSKRVVLSPPRHTKLTSFSFEPSSLLSPVFLPWTAAVLQNSQITTIGIYVTMRDYGFFQVLADTFPHLRRLEIRRLGAVSEAFAKDRIFSLLSRLSELETLCIPAPHMETVTFWHEPSSAGSPAPRLPRLKSLSATIPFVISLLEESVLCTLPSLRELEILVSLSSTSILEGSMATLFEDLRRHGLAPAVTLAVVFCPCWDSDLLSGWPRRAFDDMLGDDWAQWSTHITGLDVSVKPPKVYENVEYLSVLRDRLGRFPALRHVSFSDGSANRSVAEEAEVAALVFEAVERANPQIQTILFNGKECNRRRC